jgi:class 3 adenylate cyclase
VKIKDSIFTEESREQIADFEVKYETERKEREIELLKQNELINQLQMNRQRTVRNSLIAGLVLIIILAGVIYWALRQKTRSSFLIEREKDKSDRLLLNILPLKVANDLKEVGFTTPQSYDNVTIFFSDLVNFTELSSGLEPQYIIDELNKIFTEFDAIMQAHHCERLKTIGDAYMAVCGLPEPDTEHAIKIVRAAKEILGYMEERRKRSPVKWEIRIGIHSGSAVAGVVGVRKYIYDVFGDAVNTAARMEQHSVPMRINVSDATYRLTREHFRFEKREPIDIKGKGTMGMWFVD